MAVGVAMSVAVESRSGFRYGGERGSERKASNFLKKVYAASHLSAAAKSYCDASVKILLECANLVDTASFALSPMPVSAFNIWLENNVRIIVLRSTQSGRYVSFAVVLTIQTEEGWVDVGRFDTAHGIPHQDILGQKAGLLQKIWYDDISPKEVFHLAITTFQKDYELIINSLKKN